MMSDKRLLIVDDDEEIGRFIRRAAEEQGFEVRVTLNADAFRDAYADFDPTVILVDVVMPDTDGLELLKFLAENGCTRPVLMMSGYAGTYLPVAEKLGEAFGLPRVRALEKPIRLNDLRASLESAA